MPSPVTWQGGSEKKPKDWQPAKLGGWGHTGRLFYQDGWISWCPKKGHFTKRSRAINPTNVDCCTGGGFPSSLKKKKETRVQQED